ncbi:MAG: HAMP domain-containing protein [Pirellulaceae bacterium]|nr:HAMP domain-containing protein [Pirellulaceae bacterium]
MAYRSLRRVLGETSLERKCRLLFGCCLLLLISSAFWWVDRVAENLVIETTRSKGRDMVDMALMKRHFEDWETQERFKQLARELVSDIEHNQDYRYEILALDGESPIAYLTPVGPADATEEAVLLSLKRKLRRREELLAEQEHQQQQAEQRQGGAGAAPDTQALLVLGHDANLPPVFEERPLPARDEYHYYEAIQWKTSCRRCHQNLQEAGAMSAAQGGAAAARDASLHAVKVTIPYRATQDAINSARAILIAVAILTVFAAMVALYVIVRYVVVRPLKHLRDVSDDISRGKTELRAEIHTNDEFEELAASFNRMLRHLTDAQTELQQVNHDLDAKVDQLAQLNMRLYEMNRLKGDFLANMSHELRTPLNSIIGFSEVLQGIDSLSDKQKRYAQNIQKSGRVLLEMINDILDLAKMEAGKMEVRPTEFRIGAIVQAQCDMVRSLTEEKNIDLEVVVGEQLPALYQDQAKIQQILTNLLSNAIKFTPEGGRITVTARRVDDGKLELTVADTGVGIAEEDQEIIFEKFRQGTSVLGGDGLTREYSGTGLGLSIIKELCKLLGGEVSFESELGIGSTFMVVLPWTVSRRPEFETQMAARLDEIRVQEAAMRQREFAPGEEGAEAADGDGSQRDVQSLRLPATTRAAVGEDD